MPAPHGYIVFGTLGIFARGYGSVFFKLSYRLIVPIRIILLVFFLSLREQVQKRIRSSAACLRSFNGFFVDFIPCFACRLFHEIVIRKNIVQRIFVIYLHLTSPSLHCGFYVVRALLEQTHTVGDVVLQAVRFVQKSLGVNPTIGCFKVFRR